MTLDLTELKKRFQPHSLLALSVESGRLAVSLVRLGTGIEPLPALSLPLAAEELLGDPQKAAAQLTAALDAAGVRERRCVVCIPPSWALSASADLPEVSPEDLHGYFELRAEREFSTSDLRLAHSPYSLPDGKKRATLVGVPAKRLEALEKMLASAGCRPVSISLALSGSLSKTEPTLHLLANGGQTDVFISCGGGIAALRSLAGPGSCGSAAFAREIRITLGRLPEALRPQVRHARLVGSPVPGLRESLEAMGFGNIVEEKESSVGAAVECAELFLREQPVPFEFVVPEINRWPAKLERFNTQRGRQLAAIAVGGVLLLLGVYLIRSHMESSLQAEWNGMKNAVADLEGIQGNIRRFRPWFETAPQKLQALETLFAAFPEKGDVWTRSVQITAFSEKGDNGSRSVPATEALKVTVSGFTRSPSALMGLQDRLRKQPGVSALQPQQIRGNNPIQFSLTFKWEPKHE